MNRMPRRSRAWRFVLAGWPFGAVGIGLIGFGSAWAALGLYCLGIGAALLVAGGKETSGIRRGWHPAWGGAGLAIGLGAFLAVRSCLPFFAGEEATVLWSGLPERLAAVGLAGTSLSLFFICFVTVNPIVEEVAWRGVLGSPSRHLRWEDVAFAAYHLLVLGYLFPGAWALWIACLAVLTAGAWFWRQLVRSTGGLQTVTFQHAAADAGILAAVLWGGG